MLKNIGLLQQITTPFAHTSEHVQGPGGNTSYKEDGVILIKASGFTFEDVAANTGVVMLNNQLIVDKLMNTLQDRDNLENAAPDILESMPSGLKPSMEFEFHSLLNSYVLHTHSVYVNVLTCAAQCEATLSSIFNESEYILVPYVTPGFPIAAALLNSGHKNWPPIIFLKNHGIIIHGNSADEVLEKYAYVHDKINERFHLPHMREPVYETIKHDKCSMDINELTADNIAVDLIEEELTGKILIPDQSIFFRNKVSSHDPACAIFIDAGGEKIIINGSQKFINAAKSMLQAVFFIKNNINKLNLTPDHIPQQELDILHGLSTEKYRLAILKN